MAARKHSQHNIVDEIYHYHLPEKRLGKIRIKDWHIKLAVPSLVVIFLALVAILLKEISFYQNLQDATISQEPDSLPRKLITQTNEPLSGKKINKNTVESFLVFADKLNAANSLIYDSKIITSLKGQLIDIEYGQTQESYVTLKLFNNGEIFSYTMNEEVADKASVVFTNLERKSGSLESLTTGKTIFINETVSLIDKNPLQQVIISVE
jgi:hypothetical protein